MSPASSGSRYRKVFALETAVDGRWKTYNDSFNIEPNSKNIIYAKVTDHAGNVIYVNSDGIVLYTDAAQDTESISFTKTGTSDVTAIVILKDNTIDEIYCGDDRLTVGTDYAVDGDTITFKASWLNTLAAGDYTLTVHYNPLGMEYAANNGNDVPATTSIALSVQKAAGSVEITNDISKVYDGSVVPDVTYQASSTGAATVEYKVRGADDSSYTAEKPSTVDEYTVRVTVASDDDYNKASVTKDFDITYLSAPSDPFALSGAEGTDGWYTSSVKIIPPAGYIVSKALNGVYSDNLTISSSEENITIYLKNELGQMTDGVSVGDIKIDKDNPEITVVGDTETIAQSDTVSITAEDNTSGVAKVEVKKDNGEFADITNSFENGYSVTENGTYTFRVTDKAGRTAEKELIYNCIDTQKPVVIVNALHGGETYTDGTWSNKDVTLSVSNSTVNLGETKLEYRIDDGEWQTYSEAITVSKDTNGTTYTFRADSASGVESDEVSITVRLDKTAPGEIDVSHETNSFREFMNTITFGLFFKDTQTVTISARDAGSGVNEISYRLGSGELQTVESDEDGKITFNVTPQFTGNINSVTVTDNAGNSTSATEYQYFAVDSAAPVAPTVSTGSYTSGEWTNEDVTITVSGVTADSGIARYQYSTDGGESWEDMTPGKIMEATATAPANVDDAQLTVSAESVSADGTSYIFRAVSNSEMEGMPSSPITVRIDKTEPTIEVFGNTTEKYLQSDTVDIEAAAGLSGITKVTVSKDRGETVDITESCRNGYEVTENGTYTFTVTSGTGMTDTDSITYANIDSAKPVVEITATDDGAAYTDGTWTNKDVILSAANSADNLGATLLEYKVGDDGEWQDYQGEITISEETGGTKYIFRATSESGVVSEESSITVRVDKTVPDGDIMIEENTVKTLINTVTFGLFFKDNVDVSITSEDADSGVQSIVYYRSDAALTEEQVAALTDEDWTTYTGTIGVTAADAEKFVYYVRITDNADNMICFASNGATSDLTAPVISGVADGATCYTSQKVQVTDDNLAAVTLNGADAGSEITLAGNTSMEYIIVATDKAGNQSAVTVNMKTTESLSEAISGVTTDNVTSVDQKTIEDYLDDLNTRLEDENLTGEEKEIIQSLVDNAQDLLDKIDEAAQAGNSENVQNVQNITTGNVMMTDKGALTTAREDIEKALADYRSNYTEEEQAQLEEMLKQIDDALAVIERVEDIEEAVNTLPDSVSPDDVETEEQIDFAKEQYDALSDYEKTLVSAETADKLQSLITQLGDYRIVEGDGNNWTKESSEDLTFIANGAYSKFTGLEIDGDAVDPESYTVSSGSTVITLKVDYLNTLTSGEHTITVLYTDGEATGRFTIIGENEEPGTEEPETEEPGTEKPETTDQGNGDQNTSGDNNGTSSATGDNSSILLWVVLLSVSGAGVIGIVIFNKKRRNIKGK